MVLTEGGQPTSIGSIRNLMANLPLYYILRHHRRTPGSFPLQCRLVSELVLGQLIQVSHQFTALKEY